MNTIGKGNKAKRRIEKNRHNRLWNIQKEIAREIDAYKEFHCMDRFENLERDFSESYVEYDK